MIDTADAKTTPPSIDYYSNWGHHRIGTIIRISDDFIVHIDKDGKLDWETTNVVEDEFKTLSQTRQKELNQAYGDIVVGEAISLEGYAEEHKLQYKKMLGEAYVHWIMRDAATANKLVTAAREYYRERSEETSRKWYLTTTATTALLFCIPGAIAWLMRVEIISFVGQGAFNVGLAACTGAIGAHFSVIARSGKLKVKSSAGKALHVLEASSRICAGAISGVIAYLALTSELVLASMLKNSHRTEILFLAALAAGAGERLATSIISKFDEPMKPLRENAASKHTEETE